MPGEGQQIGQLADGGEAHPADQLHGVEAVEPPQVQLGRLREAREVVHAHHQVVAVLAEEGEDGRVRRGQLGVRAEPEGRVLLADLDHPAGPVQQRRRRGHRRLHVGHLVAVDRVHDGRQVEPPRIAGGEAGVAVGRPLHRGPHGVPVAQPDVVAHADLVAVVEDRRAGQGEQQRGEQLDLVAVVVQERGQPPPDADVGAHPRVLGVLRVHVVALLVGDHLQGQLVVVAQEDAPLAVLRDRRGLGQDLGDGVAGLPPHRHEDARHHREVERHVALVAAPGEVAEVVDDVLRPLVGLGEQHRVRVGGVDLLADPLQEGVGRREVLAVGAFLLVEVRHGVEAEAVDAQVQPEPQRGQDLLLHGRVLVVEVRLVREEPVPVVLLAHRVEGPVGRLGVDEDDPGVLVLLVVVGPDVVVAVGAVRVGAGLLEPRVLVAGVVHHEVDDHPHAALVRGVHELDEVRQVTEVRQHRRVVGHVVTAVAERGLEEGRQPEAVDPQPLQVVQSGREAPQVADAVAVAVLEGADQHLVEHGPLEPVGVPVLGGGVLERVVDGLVHGHDVGDPPIGGDGRRTERCGSAGKPPDDRHTTSTCAGLTPGSRRT
ncbi:hypothetical protein BG846_04419 [Streptomyces fradiae ATCC 10745 = DSM 40063]|uniref:Uncharacterized protein n=1 Tax=Streptomyces fradiae ATCC 10745 = DSM 40063 TaxID=1319510 RepID=A0A1Y2NR33_STRFR|nr:hypothetical protein BG846_04419 [Streptomyces fradiae ATCC 10745 = DSM 40063]